MCKGRKIKDFNQDEFRNKIEQTNWDDFHSSNDPNQMWEIMKGNFLKILDTMCPESEFPRKKATEKWISHDLLELINRKYATTKRATAKIY